MPQSAFNPRQPDGNRPPKAIQEINHLLAVGELAEARQAGLQALRRFGNDPQVHLLLAKVAERTGERALMRQHVEKSIAARPHHIAFALLSQVERMEGHTDASLAACDRALALAPGDPQLLIHKAGTLEEAGRFAEARGVVDPLVASFEQRGEPLPALLRFGLANRLVRERSLDRAIAVLDELVAGKPVPVMLSMPAHSLRAEDQARA